MNSIFDISYVLLKYDKQIDESVHRQQLSQVFSTTATAPANRVGILISLDKESILCGTVTVVTIGGREIVVNKDNYVHCLGIPLKELRPAMPCYARLELWGTKAL